MLGMTVLPILGSLRYYASDDLARIFGDSLAGSISERAANIGQTVKKIGQSIAEQISDFSREPESPVIDAATLSAWMVCHIFLIQSIIVAILLHRCCFVRPF